MSERHRRKGGEGPFREFEQTGAPLLPYDGSVTLSLLRLVVPFDRLPPPSLPPARASVQQIDLIVSKFI